MGTIQAIGDSQKPRQDGHVVLVHWQQHSEVIVLVLGQCASVVARNGAHNKTFPLIEASGQGVEDELQ